MIEVGGEILDTLSGTCLFTSLSERSIGSAIAEILHRPIRSEFIFHV